MPVELLATKLFPPAASPNRVPRPALLARLDECLQAGHRLILVSAPAGYGKTTLVGDWLRARELPVGWLSLDDSDNDPIRFAAYLVAALQAIQPALAARREELLGTARQPDDPDLLNPLLNLLALRKQPGVIVLDDYHVITSRQVHRAVSFLLEHLPQNTVLVLLTRADPPLPVARLRGRAQLTELRLSDLRFQPVEAAALLHKLTGQPCTASLVDLFTARTEGWIAGLQMAATSWQRAADPQRFVAEFSGSHRHILDYLIAEVLQTQPPAIQNFLLRTAILDRLSAPLCAALLEPGAPGLPEGELTPSANSQATLEYLEQANLFTIPLDNQRHWYRYHRLFADLLRNRLHHLHPDWITELHQRASLWLVEHDDLASAIQHSLAAADYPRAADLIESAAEATFMRSEIATFLRWIERLPRSEQSKRLGLALYCAWARSWDGTPVEAVSAELAEVAVSGADQERISLLRAFQATMGGDLETAEALASQALADLAPQEHFQHSLAEVILASIILAKGDTVSGMAAMEHAALDSQRHGNILFASLMLSNMADFRRKQGNFKEAQHLYTQALQLASTPQGHRYPIAGRALLGLGELARLQNELDQAEVYLTEGVELAQGWSRLGIFMGQVSLLRTYQNLGKRQQARDLLAELFATAEKTDGYLLDDLAAGMVAAELALDDGDLESVRRWAASRGFASSLAAPPQSSGPIDLTRRMLKYEALLVARFWLKDGQPQAALQLLESFLPEVEQADRRILLVEYLSILAIVHQALDHPLETQTVLQRALQLAAENNLCQLFIDLGAPMQALLEQALQQSQAPEISEFIRRLLVTSTSSPPTAPPLSSPPELPRQGLLQELSSREGEVLRLFPSRLSASEMAGHLYISVHTLRSHIKSIYSKLDVHSRYEAVERARELGLLD